jgi:hypothetical protein
VVEGLSRDLSEEKNSKTFIGVPLTQFISLTHLLFIDDVLILCSGLRGDEKHLSSILDIFSRATRMQINNLKSTLSTYLMYP